MAKRKYPTSSEQATAEDRLRGYQETKAKLEVLGIEAPGDLLKKIEEVSSQTREKLPKWVTDPQWIEKLENLKGVLEKKIPELEGTGVSKKTIQALRDQLQKVNNVLDEPKAYLHGMSKKEYAEKISGKSYEKKKRELSPEAAERTLSTLKTRFNVNSHLHEGCDWNRVKTALEANPEALWSINQMETQGHMPDVYNFDDNGFDIGTCSEETPSGARNCVYDAQAAAWLREDYPKKTFNGSAVEMAEAMGISLMSPTQYRKVLQRKGKFDRQTWSWLLTGEAIRKSGVALYGDRNDRGVRVDRNVARNHNGSRAWRGSLRVLWA